MRRRSALLAASVLSLAFLSVAPARAQAPPPPPPQGPSATDARALAETLFFTARGLMEAGRYAEACGKLSESYRLDAAPGTLLNLAVCNEKIGKTASAWGEFRDSLAEARRGNRPDREKLATEHIAALEPELSYLTISVPPLVRVLRGIEIQRNGVPLQSAAWDTDLPVDPGDVEVTERAPLYKPKTLHVTVAPKQHAAFTAVPLDLAPIERAPVAFWTGKRVVGLTVALVGLAAAGGGAALGVLALNDKKKSDDNCPTYAGETRCQQAGVDAMSRANNEAWASNIAFGVAALGVGIGTYLFLAGGGHEAPPPATASTHWSWAVSGGPGSAMGTLTGRF
ncbi:MAG TPA: hypothetical protein VGL81_02985 [Polyangiaceae bacterium]|jgi:hypothetical protein